MAAMDAIIKEIIRVPTFALFVVLYVKLLLLSDGPGSFYPVVTNLIEVQSLGPSTTGTAKA
jgi:hypothetical protein